MEVYAVATSRGFDQFATRMEFRANELRDGINRLVRKIALAADQAIVLATPVDTGAARSNWIVSLTAARSGTISPYAPGQDLGRGEGQNAQSAISQALSVISQRRPGQDVFIQNNLPYIGVLNDGSSRQAPAGFVQVAITQAAAAVDNARIFVAP